MVQRGTVVNGVIVPEGSPPPEGTLVVFEPTAEFEYPHPMAPYDYAKEVAILRESIDDMKAGRGQSVDARTFLKELAIKRGLPLEPGE